MEPIPSLVPWLLRTSWQTSILIVILILTQWLLRHRLPARWRYGLWLLVIARALLPTAPSSAWSVFNLTGSYPPTPSLTFRTSALSLNTDSIIASVSDVERSLPPRASPAPLPRANSPLVPASVVAPPRVAPLTGLPTPTRPPQASPRSLLISLVWLGGFLWMVARTLIPQARFRLRLRRGTVVDDPAVLRLLQQCGQVMKLRSLPRLIRTPAVQTPTLHGFWRPCVLLPDGTVDTLNATELRYVLLHELAHIKRRDMPVLWLMTFLKALHWFNPLFRIAANRLGAAAELACDHWVMARLHDRENLPYGATIVKMLERLAPPAPLPGVLGIAEDKRRLFERITAIGDFKTSTKVSLAGVVVIALVLIFCLTDARPRDNEQTSPPAHRPPPVMVSLSCSNGPLKLFRSEFDNGLKYHFILPDGALWVWDPRHLNPMNATPALKRVGTDTDWVKVQTFQDRCVGLRRDGTLSEWVEQTGGLLLAQPVPLDLGSEWRDMAIGSRILVALKKDGTLWGRIASSWFNNTMGPLPTGMCQIGTNTDWQSVGGGKDAYGPATRKDGSLWTWDLVSWSAKTAWSGRFSEPTRLGNDDGWTILDAYEPALAMSDQGEVWDATTLFERMPGHLTGACYARNATPDRFALATKSPKMTAAFHIRDDGTLWESPYPPPLTNASAFQQVGMRADWAALWGTETAVGFTADGTIWTWGSDLTARPVSPSKPSPVQLAYWRLKYALGLKPSPLIPLKSVPFPILKEPLPIMRLVQTPPR